MTTPITHHRLPHIPSAALALGALLVALNAWTYSYANGIPLVQSDAWVFLDTYVRRYLEDGFGWRDFFLQAHSSDTNLPLHKLVMLFHINHFNMDFKVEGLIGVACGIALVGLLTIAAAGLDPSRWRLAGFALLAWLALVTLSLNSSNIYTWPLATMWFLNLLLVSVYLVLMARPQTGPRAALAATMLLGLLLDEVALITVMAAVAAVLIQPDGRPWRARAMQCAAAVVGMLIVRLAYWWFNTAHGVVPEPASTPGLLQNLVNLVWSQGLQLVLIPLSDSLVHQSALQEWAPQRHALIGTLIGSMLAALHVAFWWQAVRTSDALPPIAVRGRRVAIALMLFFYGTVAGIALQRIPVFGIEYLHQPRYVIFYQLNLAALGLMAYSAFTQRVISASTSTSTRYMRPVGAMLMVAVLATGWLQWHLSLRSWEHAKYLSVFIEGTAATMGELAADPAAQMQCSDILTVCTFPTSKRRELMFLLQNYRLNIFNPDFQAFHRLRPVSTEPSQAENSDRAPGSESDG